MESPCGPQTPTRSRGKWVMWRPGTQVASEPASAPRPLWLPPVLLTSAHSTPWPCCAAPQVSGSLLSPGYAAQMPACAYASPPPSPPPHTHTHTQPGTSQGPPGRKSQPGASPGYGSVGGSGSWASLEKLRDEGDAGRTRFHQDFQGLQDSHVTCPSEGLLAKWGLGPKPPYPCLSLEASKVGKKR